MAIVRFTHTIQRHVACPTIEVEGDRVRAFGSTMGNLWTIVDGGDSWTQLSSTLPPIYCVRLIVAAD